MRPMAQAKWRRTRAVELAVQGLSYDAIAKEVGFSHRGSAHRAVIRALAEREVHAVDELRHIELERLEQLHQSYWSAAIEGDRDAASMILKITDRRIRLLGLEKESANTE